MHMASLLFSQDDLEAFHAYRERRLLMVPLDLLLIETIREPTVSVGFEESSRGNLKEDSKAESHENSTHESKHLEKQSQNGGNKNKNSEWDTTRTIEKAVE